MAQGRIMEQWQHTTALMAMIHNVNCAKARDTREPFAFDPFCQGPAAPATGIDWGQLHADLEAKHGRKT